MDEAEKSSTMGKDEKAVPEMVERAVPKKAQRACGLCGKTKKLTKTECCNNWICDDYHKYVMFSYARNSCYRNHERYTLCSYHHHEGHDGKWQDCKQCKQGMDMVHYVDCATNDYNFEKLENISKVTITCSNCGFESETLNDFLLTVVQGNRMDFFCKKVECQNTVEETKKRSMTGKVEKAVPQKVERAVPKKAQRACGLCGKTKKLTKTECCNNWICNDSDQYILFSYARNSCYRNYNRYTLCSYHLQEGHDGKWQDCEKCKQGMDKIYYDDFATNSYNFEKLENVSKVTITCSNCGFKSECLDDFSSASKDGNTDFFCTKMKCQKKFWL